jgi:hypothetical protein
MKGLSKHRIERGSAGSQTPFLACFGVFDPGATALGSVLGTPSILVMQLNKHTRRQPKYLLSQSMFLHNI